jgi:hypothetical protein
MLNTIIVAFLLFQGFMLLLMLAACAVAATALRAVRPYPVKPSNFTTVEGLRILQPTLPPTFHESPRPIAR